MEILTRKIPKIFCELNIQDREEEWVKYPLSFSRGAHALPLVVANNPWMVLKIACPNITQMKINRICLEYLLFNPHPSVFVFPEFGVGVGMASAAHMLNIPYNVYYEKWMFGQAGERFELTDELMYSIICTQAVILKAYSR